VKHPFRFSLRLFACLVAAKFLLHLLGVEGRGWLAGVTALLLANLYWLEHLAWRDRFPFSRGG
jgi:hypothetical protein